MEETHPPRRVGRSIGAVLAGLLTVVVLDTGIDAVMHATGIYPPWGQPMAGTLFLLATAYRMVDGIAGSYIAARLAPHRPMQHALILGAVGIVLSSIGAVVTWNKGPAFGPHWYPIALIVIAMPCASAGGKLRLIQLQARPSP
jgi:hypothetical protein